MNSVIQFADLCAVYYVVQLVRCAFFSFPVFAAIFILRKTLLKDKVFLKGALWSLFIPVLFIGKMKFFYENRIGVKLFSWITEICMNRLRICWLYLCVVLLYAFLLISRRRRLKKMVAGMEKINIDGTPVYVTNIPVTPSVIGTFRPKIVMPEIILKEYDREDFQIILLHEKIHIRSGHLFFYLLWDILRVLLWINPLLAIGTKFFREDMEEICDWVTIQRSGGKAYAYGQLLLKSMKILQAESEEFNMYVAFAGDKGYQNVRQRVIRIARYKPYKRLAAAGTWIAAVLCMAAVVFLAQSVSYGRYNSQDSVAVYDIETGAELVSDSEALRKAVYYDENYVYIELEALNRILEDAKKADGKICIYFGGYYKLPGIGCGGSFGCLETADLGEGVIKIEYTRQKDIFEYIIKLI